MVSNLLKVQKEFSSNEKVKILSHTVMPWFDDQENLIIWKNEYMNSNFWYLLTD